MGRMEKYHDDSDMNVVDNSVTRSNRNKRLYDDVDNFRVTSVDGITDIGVVIDTSMDSNTREKYREYREYKDIINTEYGDKEIVPIIYNEDKIYDINVVLEEAKKNKPDSGFRSIPSNYLGREDQNEIKELVDTITSFGLRDEINSALANELMPDDPIDNKESEVEGEKEDVIDKSFFTSSMEISTKDLVDNSNNEDEVVNKKSGKVKVIVSVLITLILVAGLVVLFLYFVK